MDQPARIVVVGIGADGWDGVPPRLRSLVNGADVLLGGPRHLDLVPLVAGQVREAWPSPLRSGLPSLLSRFDGRRVVALASGDPFVSGIGTTLVSLMGADAVEVHPAASSVALAAARMGWPSSSYAVVSLVGRDPHLVLREAVAGRRVIVLSADETTPSTVAPILTASGHGESVLTVLGDLGSAAESRVAVSAQLLGSGRSDAPDAAEARQLSGHGDPGRPPDVAVPRLNVIAIEVAGAGLAPVPGLPDDAFEHDGQLTKRDLRASALARLAPAPGEVLWDVGAGAGSIGIEWMRGHPTCAAYAVEADAERAGRIARNAERLGVPGLTVVSGVAPDALAGLPAPDAIFVGGGATNDGVIDACLAALPPGGRLVVHGVTLETERLLGSLHAEHGGELVRVAVETAEPIGTFTGWTPARGVTQWSLVR